MERTPSPPRRINTPPAPQHGAKHDSYEPYSPRRSSRVAAQRDQQSSPTRSRFARSARETTPTSSRKKPAARTSLQGFSPPSSPISPNKHRSPRSTRRPHFHDTLFDSDSDHIAPTPARRFLSAVEPRGMLPTPVKTPRKRSLQSEEALSSTARVLFPSRPATIEEAMPTPRKGRRSTKNVFSLDSFHAQTEEEGEQIPIFTDSKDRVPTADKEEDNPFVTKKGKSKAKTTVSRPRKTDAKTRKMEDSVDRDEGMIYIFRGKKVYRKFHDGPASNASDEVPEFSGDEVRRNVGHEAHRPLTRSAIKPRLLFQEEIKAKRQQEMGPDDIDEEAVTDIEVPIATPSNRKARKVVSAGTPSIRRQEATPPPTVPKTRRTYLNFDPDAMDVDDETEISFDSWSRVKSASRESSSTRGATKRSGDTLESTTEKRTRSEQSSAMSIDSI